MPKIYNMFLFQKNELLQDVHQYKVYKNGVQLTFKQVIEYWQNNSDFRQFYHTILAANDFDAYFWENPPINKQTLHQPYEFVLVNSRALSHIQASKQAFSRYFEDNKNEVVCFENLGKDALLIVPTPLDEKSAFSQISVFVRTAKNEQLQMFWQTVGQEIEKRVSNKNLWVSTSGLGVYWLHVRLDDSPKYYQYQPYKNRLHD